jgi:hypothetical protein
MKNIKDELQNTILGDGEAGSKNRLKKVQIFLRRYAEASSSTQKQQHFKSEETVRLINFAPPRIPNRQRSASTSLQYLTKLLFLLENLTSMKPFHIKYLAVFRCVITVLVLIFLATAAFSQCIDRQKIDWSEDGLFFDYGYLTPSYSFAFKGDTSKQWNIQFANIDIRQAPANALKFKSKVDRAIKVFAGSEFFQNLKFDEVSVCFPERLKLFTDSGAQVSLEHFKSKYTYSYSFEPDSITGYNIVVAVNRFGKIITPFIFPSKRFYKPIDKSFTYCKLIEIARKAQKNIDPIDKISFEYDKKKKRFYWFISQALVNEHEGANYVNVVYIDAADLKKVTTERSTMFVVY